LPSNSGQYGKADAIKISQRNIVQRPSCATVTAVNQHAGLTGRFFGVCSDKKSDKLNRPVGYALQTG
jgi:hypothetical protein